MSYGISYSQNKAPRMVQYSTDGLGRDTYISHNNGGYWPENTKQIYIVDKFDVPKHKYTGSLKKNVAPFKYYSDGSGRDSYVIHESGGLKRDHKPLSNYHLKDFLRTAKTAATTFRPVTDYGKVTFVTPRQFQQNKQTKKLEKGLTQRLYYSELSKLSPSRCEKKYKDMLRSYGSGESFFPKIKSGSNNCSKNKKMIDRNNKTDGIDRIDKADKTDRNDRIDKDVNFRTSVNFNVNSRGMKRNLSMGDRNIYG